MLDELQKERYARHLIMKGFGLEAQEKLLAGSVLVVGAGGLGSPVALYLAAAGVGRIGIVDSDVVDLSNLQRQILHTEADVGIPKALSAAQSMNAINSGITVEPHCMLVDDDNAEELFAQYDFVIDASDNFDTKFLINDVCVRMGKPFCHGSVMGFDGQMLTYVPGRGPCYRCIFKEPPPAETARTAKTEGIIGAVAGAIGCLQAMEAIRFLTGVGELMCGRLLIYEGFYGEFREIELGGAEPDCPACQAARE